MSFTDNKDWPHWLISSDDLDFDLDLVLEK